MCPHSIRLVTHGYEDIYGITMQDAKIFQSVISPKGDENPFYMSNHSFDRAQASYRHHTEIPETLAYRTSLKERGHTALEQLSNQASWQTWKERNGLQNLTREAVIDMVRDRVWRYDHSPARTLEREQSAVRTLERGATPQHERPAPQHEPERAPKRSVRQGLQGLGRGMEDAPQGGVGLRVRLLDRERDENERGMSW
jgi:hypothetical protein